MDINRQRRIDLHCTTCKARDYIWYGIDRGTPKEFRAPCRRFYAFPIDVPEDEL